MKKSKVPLIEQVDILKLKPVPTSTTVKRRIPLLESIIADGTVNESKIITQKIKRRVPYIQDIKTQ